MFVWSVLGALLLPTIRGLPLCVFVRTYGVLLVPVCMHSDYEPCHNINAQFECADYTSAEDTSWIYAVEMKPIDLHQFANEHS